MSSESTNVIVTIIDTIDGAEEEVVNLDDISIEELQKSIQDVPELLPYLLQRIEAEVGDKDSQ